MENTKNAVAVTTDQNKVTQELLMDYLKTMNKNLTDSQVKQFLAVAGTFGLNPWKKEVYPVVYKNKDGSYDMSIVTGYEVYLKRAEMNQSYDGYEIKWQGSFAKGSVTKHGKNGDYTVSALVPQGEVSCTCTVYRKDRQHPISEQVFFDEYDQGNSMWQTKPRTMLKKVAIVSAFRKAFPLEFGGMPYASEELPEEMSGADKLKEKGFTEVQAENENAEPADQQQTAAIENHSPLSDKKRADFYTMLSQQSNRIGSKAVNEYCEKMGGIEKIVNDRELAVKVATELGNMQKKQQEEVEF